MMLIKKLKGLGLIEVMMTLLIIAGSVVALLRFQSYLAYENNLSNQKAIATQIANSKVESLRDYSALTGSNSYANIASGTSTQTGSNTTYTLTWTVTSFSNPTYKTIDVTVSWTDQHNATQSTRLISTIAQVDPGTSATIMAL